MGLFSRNSDNIDWQHLEEMDQLGSITQASFSKPQMIFKHSTRCGVSSMVRSKLSGEWAHNDRITPWHLDLLKYRNISNEIADRFGIHHESPQIIIIVDGQATRVVSHTSLSNKELDAIAA